MDNKTAVFTNYKKDIIRAIDRSVDYLKSNPDRYSCSMLMYFLSTEAPTVQREDVMREYRKVCRARCERAGFRGYTHEQWFNKCQNDQQKIRIKKLEKLKKHFIDNY